MSIFTWALFPLAATKPTMILVNDKGFLCPSLHTSRLVMICICLQIRSMRFVKGLDLLVVVEGTAILKIYSAGPHKLGQIEPAIAIRTLMIDTKRSKRVVGPKANPRGDGGGGGGGGGGVGGGRAEGAAAASKENEVCSCLHLGI